MPSPPHCALTISHVAPSHSTRLSTQLYPEEYEESSIHSSIHAFIHLSTYLPHKPSIQQYVTNAASYPPRCPSHVGPTTHAGSVESPSPNSPHFFKPPNVNLASISLALSLLSVGGSSSMQPSSPTSDANPLSTQRSPSNHQQPTSLLPTGFPVFAAPWV